MSWQWVELILDYGPQAQADAMLLLGIGERAKWLPGETMDGVAAPSVESLAARARMSVRHAQRRIRAMQDDGWVVVMDGGGRHKTNIYRLCRTRFTDPIRPINGAENAEIEALLKRFEAQATPVPAPDRNPDTMSPFPESKTVTSRPETVTFEPRKGDTRCHPNQRTSRTRADAPGRTAFTAARADLGEPEKSKKNVGAAAPAAKKELAALPPIPDRPDEVQQEKRIMTNEEALALRRRSQRLAGSML